MSKELKVLIVEDEGIIAEHLKVLVRSYGTEQIFIANEKKRAIELLEMYKPDLVLLDIRMKNPTDGIEIAEEINIHYKIPFIFITAHSDSLLLQKALNTKPAGYVTKPFNQATIYAAIKIALDKLEQKEAGYIIIKDGFDTIKIDVESIIYVESDRNYIDIVCEKGKHSVRHSLEWFIGLEQIHSQKFMRVHRSFIINIKKANRISGSNVIVQQFSIPISRKYISELRTEVALV